MAQELVQKSFSVPAALPDDNVPAHVDTKRLSVQVRQREEQRRKLSENRGVFLPDIHIMPPNTVFRAHSAGDGPGQDQSSLVRTPITAASPVGTVIRFKSNSTMNSSGTNTMKQKPLDMRIFLSDNRAFTFSVEGGRTVTSLTLAHHCADYLELPPDVACEAFSLWMVSPLMEVPLKSHHMPFAVRKCWPDLLIKYTHETEADILVDEPLMIYKRNVFLSKRRQRLIAHPHPKCVELLYIDARESVLLGRQPMALATSLELAAIDMAIQWGPYNREKHTMSFIRDNMCDLLPECHLPSATGFTFFGLSSCGGVCNQLIERYKELSVVSAEELRLMYLDKCMKLHTYGSANFCGQIERAPAIASLNNSLNKGSGIRHWLTRSLSGATQGDIHVRLAINRQHINIIDEKTGSLVFTRSFLDCHWRTVRSCNPEDRECLPSVFLHFPSDQPISVDNGENEVIGSHLLQIFSHQAPMIEALLNSCFDITYEEFQGSRLLSLIEKEQQEVGRDPMEEDQPDGANGVRAMSPVFTDSFLDDRDTELLGVTNRLDKFCVADLDAAGNCIHAMGSLKKVLQHDIGRMSPQQSKITTA